MAGTIYTQGSEVLDRMVTFNMFPVAVETQEAPEFYKWLADLSPDTSWGERKIAARELGCTRNPAALPGLLEALPDDPFWMVRCAIIQALEMIGDSAAIPTLREVEKRDCFQVVRSHAAKAIERLSPAG